MSSIPISMRGALKDALYRTYTVIAGDLAQAREFSGEDSLIPRDELIDVVLDQTYGGFMHLELSKQNKLNEVWKTLSSAERLEIARETFDHDLYE